MPTPITPEQIQAAKNANPGDEFSIFGNLEFDIEWLMKVPSDSEWQAWRAQQSAAGDDITPVNREFLIRHVVVPAGVTDPSVRQALGKHPGLVEAGVRAIAKLAGARAEFTVKKV
jgi:hypothetical protein